MTALFDERVEKAIHLIWFDIHSGRREEALSLLRDAANEGDGDAYYFLGRCYLGRSYVDPVLEMPEDPKFAYECFDMSLTFGSDIGEFGTLHLEEYANPLRVFYSADSKKKVWDAVFQKAARGHLFCKFLIANEYYYGTAADFLDITPEDNPKQYERLQYEWTAAAVRLYEACVTGGLGIALPNLIDLLMSGKNGAPVQRQKAENYINMGAEMGIGACERVLGNRYRDDDRLAKAVEMYERALAHNDIYAYYCLGRLYTFGGALALDLGKALSYLEKGFSKLPDDAGFCNLLGEIYFRGGQGVERDFDQAFLLLSRAYFSGNTWGADMLGTCYLNGLGCAPNPALARQLFETCPEKPLAASGLKRLKNILE